MPKYTQPRKTWQYSNEFKVKAVIFPRLIRPAALTLDQ